MKKEKSKKRLDLLLVEKNLIATRSRARAEIMAGNVLVNGIKKDKPGEAVSSQAKIEILATQNPYVSRGGLKLEKALREFSLKLENKIVLDIGASTGGFTHCVLKHGAQKVYALDVGYGQLDWKLRHEPRIINMERFNVRHLKREDLQERPHLATIDVSFISLSLVLPVVAALFVPEIICLVKPQFEAKPAQVAKRGVVKDAAVHREVLEKIISTALQLSYRVEGLTFSPLKGPRGNIEYLLYLRAENAPASEKKRVKKEELSPVIDAVVTQAHFILKR
jgi:23S rRNA (cytidine1920-2'-O)/16S rRNA (cytidine1409-2'-O)-methyltransferase